MGLSLTAFPKSVLVIEDDDDVRNEIVEALTRAGYHVVEARDGRSGLDTLVHMHPRPAVILLDWMMPVLDGLGFLSQQASDPRIAAVPVVVLSAVARMSRIPSLCVAAVLQKPVRLRTLIEVVDRMAGVGPRGGGTGGEVAPTPSWDDDTDVMRVHRPPAATCDSATSARRRAVTEPEPLRRRGAQLAGPTYRRGRAGPDDPSE